MHSVAVAAGTLRLISAFFAHKTCSIPASHHLGSRKMPQSSKERCDDEEDNRISYFQFEEKNAFVNSQNFPPPFRRLS